MNLGMKLCGWAIVGLLVVGTGRAEDGEGWIVDAGRQVVGVDLSTDLTAAATREHSGSGSTGYPVGDLDHDCDVDLNDSSVLANCMNGPDVSGSEWGQRVRVGSGQSGVRPEWHVSRFSVL